MKLIKKDKQAITIKVENLDDLWYLSMIVEPADLVQGKTFRKIKIGQDENAKVVKKPVFIEIKVEKVEFSKTTNALRILGIITQSPDDIPKGEHHSFALEEQSVITIKKEHWPLYQLDKLEDACSEKLPHILIIVHDREEAFFALMKKYGFELLVHLEGEVQKKAEEKKITKSFYSEIHKKMYEYVERYKIKTIVVASPAFWKEELLKELKDDELKKKIISATCSSVDKTAINEVLKRDEVKNALQQDRITKEINLVEELLAGIKKEDLAVYGIKDTKNAVEAGAVKQLLVTDLCIQRARDSGKYYELETVMKTAESMKAQVTIISAEHDGGKKLNGLGGIGALLRYKLNY